MKIAIPTINKKLCMHFGHCEKFTIIDIDSDKKTVIGSTELKPPPHEPGILPRWLSEQNVTTIIAGGMGQRAQALFASQDIEVIVGVQDENPEVLIKAYLDGILQSGVNACDH